MLQDTVANAGEVRRPEALRNLYETALATAGLTNAKATPQEMESLRRASNMIRAKVPAAETIAAREEVKDPRQLAMEARVAPKAPKGITPLRDAVAPEIVGEPLPALERKVDVNKRLDATGSRISPAGDRPSSADGGDGAVRRAGELTTPDDSGVGSPLLGDGVIGDGTKSSSDPLETVTPTPRGS